MVEKLYKNLYSPLVESIGGIGDSGGAQPQPPQPIQYLTAWRLVGNSSVHTDQYLTQWKVEGNSVVDNNTILSCGDYSSVDGKYHVKVSNGVNVYDIALTEPLRKVGSVADDTTFTNGVATVTRYLKSVKLSDWNWGMNEVNGVYMAFTSGSSQDIKKVDTSVPFNGLCPLYTPISRNEQLNNSPTDKAMFVGPSNGYLFIYDSDYSAPSLNEFKKHINGVELIYELATPTTEVIQVPQIAVSATDTYISATTTPYSSFTCNNPHEIWSCGEYSAVDGKYHIKVSNGVNVFDIALNEPLRKVNDVADKIEFANNVATVTRNLGSENREKFVVNSMSGQSTMALVSLPTGIKVNSTTSYTPNILIDKIPNTVKYSTILNESFAVTQYGSSIEIRNTSIEQTTAAYNSYFTELGAVNIIYELDIPTTETIEVPEIEVSDTDTYTQVISQGAKAVEWSSFTANPE